MAERKKKRPESAATASRKCEFCKKIGSHYTVDYHNDDAPPEEFKKFRVLYDEGFYFSIIRCRRCRTVYKRNRYVDNEICNESDADEYAEISEEKLTELMPYFWGKQKKFKSKLHQQLRDKISSLSKDEKAVINIFIKYQKYFLRLGEFMARAREPLKSVLKEVLAGLVAKGILKASGSAPTSEYSVPGWQ